MFMENILLLNQDYTPLNVTTLRRGFKLVFKGKAEVISHDDNNPIETEVKNYQRPTVIRLLRYISLPYKPVNLTRFNIYRRDGHKCIYCQSTKRLTLDHMIPKCKGGQNTWKNLVTCCQQCNTEKGDTDVDVFLEEKGYTMTHKPYRPTYLQFVNKIKGTNTDWLPFI